MFLLPSLKFIFGLLVGGVLGIFIGYLLWKRKQESLFLDDIRDNKYDKRLQFKERRHPHQRYNKGY